MFLQAKSPAGALGECFKQGKQENCLSGTSVPAHMHAEDTTSKLFCIMILIWNDHNEFYLLLPEASGFYFYVFGTQATDD